MAARGVSQVVAISMQIKITRKELWLFATPLLVIIFALLLHGVNNYVIRQDEQRQLKPSLRADGSVMVSRQRQPDGSIKEFLHEPNGSQRLLSILPAHEVYKSKGLFRTRYVAQGITVALGLSSICLTVLIISVLLHRKRNRT
jgi:hypothetical protein